MTGVLIILVALQCAQLVVLFYVVTCLRGFEEQVFNKIQASDSSEGKGFSEERKKKISESQKARWAKKKGATKMIAPVAWPEGVHQPVS